MSRLESLKVFIQQRLTAAVEDIFGHLEKTISSYEEELDSRHRQLIDTVLRPQTADVQQQLVIKEEVSSEHQDWRSSPHIKQEEEDFWNHQEDDMTKLLFCHDPVSNDDEEKAQSSQLHQRQSEESREAEHPDSSSTEQIQRADGEICGPVSCFKCLSGSDDKTSHSPEHNAAYWKETRTPQSDLNTIKHKAPVNNAGCDSGNKLSCSKCGRRFGQKHHLQTHMRCHTGEKPFSCSICGKRFTQKGNLTKHLTVHTREKPCSCPVCGERFAQRGNLTQHMTVHTREKLCW